MAAPRDESRLAGLRVLITRPAGRAEPLQAAIEALGANVTHIPLLAVTGLDEQRDAELWQRAKQRVLELDRYRRVIAISVNAVHYGQQWIGNYWPQLPHGIDWYGIGAATIAEFARFDIRAQPAAADSAPMNSEALLALPELQRIGGERVLILRGVGGRETLAETLRARGAEVDYAECYHRVEPALDEQQRAELQRMEFDAVCVNSAETLANLWHHLAEPARLQLQRCAIVAPSVRVAAQAQALGLQRAIAADNAGTAATLAALQTIADARQVADS